ncbi:GTP-binding protein ERG-like [Rhododendron vialii]|uniref:GTP-binding protein ERG-like n=1 Tax=Rhododendron vialii TaxID=182163 RepID=UPI00265DCBE0|nr:GTP-binding protein ERG-like [Rhododendron vialii]
MKALRSLRTLALLPSPSKPPRTHLNSPLLHRLYAAPHQNDAVATTSDDESGENTFDSTQYTLPNKGFDSVTSNPTWDEKYREKADRAVFGEETNVRNLVKEEERKRRAAALARALLEAALDRPDEDKEEEEEGDLVVKEEDQKSLSVGIIGAPNAGKSALTNYMVGTKVAAVSRKTHTTTHEVLGVVTKGNTQICFFDTPGITQRRIGYAYKEDIKVRVESAWSSVDLYDVVVVIFDVHRHLSRPDARVITLIKRMGSLVNPKQKRVLCMNKVDLVEKKRDLLKVAEQFKDLPGYERYFMISGLKGSGVKDLTQYLMEQAVKRPWDEDPFTMSEEVMKTISLETVREKLLDHIHQEIPYDIEHRLVDWKELRDGSLRVEQHLITQKMGQRKILVGKNGSKIGRIGIEANEELRSIFKRNVHLILQVRLK